MHAHFLQLCTCRATSPSLAHHQTPFTPQPIMAWCCSSEYVGATSSLSNMIMKRHSQDKPMYRSSEWQSFRCCNAAPARILRVMAAQCLCTAAEVNNALILSANTSRAFPKQGRGAACSVAIAWSLGREMWSTDAYRPSLSMEAGIQLAEISTVTPAMAVESSRRHPSRGRSG